MMFGTLIDFPGSQSDTLKHGAYHNTEFNMLPEIYQFSTRGLNGQPIHFSDFQGKVVLVVNTASRCGFTPQYAQLQALHDEFAHQGLVIVAFPCNQFGGQEPEGSAEIGAFCQKNYGVDFLMSEKVDVRGRDAHPLFKYLTDKARGILRTRSIKWNFTKFLVDGKGVVLQRYAPNTRPNVLRDTIKALLEQSSHSS